MTDNRPRRGLGLCKNLLQVVLALLLAPAAFAEIPKSVPVYEFVRVTLNPDETALVIRDGLLPVATIETKDGIAFTGPPGRYLVALITPGKATPDNNFVEIVGVVPPPKPPVPDVVPPTPDVVPPTPDTDKAPLPDVAGFHVLMVYESGTLPPDIPKEQHEIPYLPTVRDWLTKNTTPANNWAGWRVGDPDAGVSQGSDLWSRMMALPRASTPWLVVNNGAKNKGYSGPMPKTADEFLKLLEGLK